MPEPSVSPIAIYQPGNHHPEDLATHCGLSFASRARPMFAGRDRADAVEIVENSKLETRRPGAEIPGIRHACDSGTALPRNSAARPVPLSITSKLKPTSQ